MKNDSYVEINTECIKNNVRNILKKYSDYKYYIGVVKGNAYGHGFEIVRELVKNGINYLAVSNLKEALEVRKLVDTPILCLQPIDINDIHIAQDKNITITISSYEYYKKLIEKNLKLLVHLKLDSGMNRLGLNNKKEIKNIYNNLINNKKIRLEGIYTHLSTTGIIDKKWDDQVNNFINLTSNIDLNKIDIVHIYSSNSLVIHPKLSFCNGCRIGILMYGISPREINYTSLKGKLRKFKNTYLRKKYNLSKIYDKYNIDVKTGFKLYSKVIEIKNIEKNQYIGYGFKYKTSNNCTIAIIPIGYADGLTLNNSGRDILINNRKYKIVGAVNMRMLTVIVDNKVNVGDLAVIIGEDIRNICQYTNVTPHKLMTTISNDVPRIYK